MTRMSKQGKRRNMCPKKRKKQITQKTGSKKDNLENGYKNHTNSVNEKNIFIAKIK